MERGSLVYLDTDATIWLYAGLTEKISPAATVFIEKGSLRISPMVLLEIQLLRDIGRFTHRPEDVIDHLGKLIGLTVCDANFQKIALTAQRQDWTHDPFDRIITAQAQCQLAPLVTSDGNIRSHYDRAIW